MAAIMTCCVTIGLTVYAWTTDTDLTYCGGLLFVMAFGLIGLSICAACLNNSWLHLMECFLAIIVYGFYLIYDT